MMKDFINGRLTFELYDVVEDKTSKLALSNLVENPDTIQIANVKTALSKLVNQPIQAVTYTQNYVVL